MAGLLAKNQDTKDYLRAKSEEFGDIEFVGDLVDDLTSNRYFPGQGGREGMDPIAGGHFGPYSSHGQSKDLYDKWSSLGADHDFATMLSNHEPTYDNFITIQDLNDRKSGGNYVGPVDYNDPKFGLVRMGLYGNGWRMEPEDENKLIDRLKAGGISREDAESYLSLLRSGHEGVYNAFTKDLGSENQDIIDRGYGGLRQERSDWVGNINMDPGQLERDRSFGYYTPVNDEIYVDPNSKLNANTMSHELMHRGISALDREYRRSGSDPNYFSSILGEDYPEGFNPSVDKVLLGINPDNSDPVTIGSFLGDRSVGGDKGANYEHNMIDSLSRGRYGRSNYLGYLPTRSVVAENAVRSTAAQGAEKLGLLANAIVDQNQQYRHDSINRFRDKFPDNRYIFGGKSGTKKSPLLDSGY